LALGDYAPVMPSFGFFATLRLIGQLDFMHSAPLGRAA
jgi:hypothetical protein